MRTGQMLRVGLLVEGEADRALLQRAAEQAGLGVVDLPLPLLQLHESHEHASSQCDLLVVDQAGVEAGVLIAGAAWDAPLCLELNAAEESELSSFTDAAHATHAPCRLKRPLVVAEVGRQLAMLAQARRAWVTGQEAPMQELHRYRSIFSSLSNGVAISDVRQPDMPLVYVNPAFEAISGYTAAEVLGRNCRFLQGSDRAQEGAQSVHRAIGEKREEQVLLRNFRKDGAPFWNELYLSPIFDTSGELTHYVGIQNDVTARVEAELQLAYERDRLHAAAESSMDALFMCEAVRDSENQIIDFMFTYLNSNVEKMVALPNHRLLGRRMCEVLPINRTLGLLDLYREVVETGRPLVHEFSISDKDVLSAWIRVQAVKLKDGIVITASDITARKHDEQRTLYIAHHDALTRLPNRTVLNRTLEQGLLAADGYQHLLGVFLIDLDGFKEINDTLGHAAGDQTLVTVAARLKHCVRPVDSVIRVGGDEFLIVMPDLHEEADAVAMANRILGTLRAPMQVAGQAIAVTSSIGIAIYPRSAHTAGELMVQSDMAMYAAKRRGKNQYELYPADAESSDGDEPEPASPGSALPLPLAQYR